VYSKKVGLLVSRFRQRKSEIEKRLKETRGKKRKGKGGGCGRFVVDEARRATLLKRKAIKKKERKERRVMMFLTEEGLFFSSIFFNE
jgi:hypothetical protein